MRGSPLTPTLSRKRESEKEKEKEKEHARSGLAPSPAYSWERVGVRVDRAREARD